MAWFWQWKERYLREREQKQKARDEASRNWEAKVAAENARDAERRKVKVLEAEIERRDKNAETAAAEKRSLIADRDGWKEEKDKQDVQNGLLHQRIKTLLEEKEAQRTELARLRDAEAARPVIQVEVKEGTQGRKGKVCFRYRARNAGDEVVAVSAPQGVPALDRLEKRIGLLSDARWVIYKVVDKNGKVSYPKEDV